MMLRAPSQGMERHLVCLLYKEGQDEVGSFHGVGGKSVKI